MTLGRVARVAGRVVLAVALVPLLLVGGCRGKTALDNRSHAARVFAQVSHDEVIASRRWHRIGAEPWDCSYAVVRLAADAPADPPPARPDTYWFEAFGGNWLPTPAPPLGDTTRDALDACALQIGPEVADLKAALAAPGSWFIRDGVGETLRIYAPSAGLAARIRYGD